MAEQTNVERLKQAGLLDPDHDLTPAKQAAVNGLSREEVDHFIAIAEKLGYDGSVHEISAQTCGF